MRKRWLNGSKRICDSDRVRNEEGARGEYSTDDKLRIYKIMVERSRKSVLAGKDVVVDGTFYLSAMIDLFRKLSIPSTQIYFISVVADEKLIRARLARPRSDSEADYEVYLRIKIEFEPLPVPYLTLQSGKDSIDEMLATALDYIRKN